MEFNNDRDYDRPVPIPKSQSVYQRPKNDQLIDLPSSQKLTTLIEKMTPFRDNVRKSIKKLQSDELIESLSQSTSAQSKKKKKGKEVESTCNDNFNEVVAMLEYNFYLLEQNIDKINKELNINGCEEAKPSDLRKKKNTVTDADRATVMYFGDEGQFEDYFLKNNDDDEFQEYEEEEILFSEIGKRRDDSPEVVRTGTVVAFENFERTRSMEHMNSFLSIRQVEDTETYEFPDPVVYEQNFDKIEHTFEEKYIGFKEYGLKEPIINDCD